MISLGIPFVLHRQGPEFKELHNICVHSEELAGGSQVNRLAMS